MDVLTHPHLGGNINGPSLIRVPDWVVDPLARYYLYFAHHEGQQIQLAIADDLAGPWSVYEPGALALEQSLFPVQAPAVCDTHPDILKAVAAGIDGDYPHIASPDVHIDEKQKKIRMYYHGRTANGTQKTRLAESADGITFRPLKPLLGESYFRVFEHHKTHYAIAWGSVLYRSTDGGYTFEAGPRLTAENYRHGAILQFPDSPDINVIWSRAGDCPESLLVSRLVCTNSTGGNLPWQHWRLSEAALLHKPERQWEGSEEPLLPSTYGGIMRPVRQIRDPAVYREDGKAYLLYSVRGEQGIALAKLGVQMSGTSV
ncbi:hypothetical protein AB833_29220 [Chromatiales bacterium (ex Bugula neritina AB1)]|nr:hypothetical protein AB833_29220 [Chromatiales bacterium (ex Bugula neritina AB1)]